MRAITEFGVKELDDAGFKRLVEYVEHEYPIRVFREYVSNHRIKYVKPNASKKTLARFVLMAHFRWAMRNVESPFAPLLKD